MGDYSIKAAFEVNTAPDEVRRWLDNLDGIGGWWSDGVSGSAAGVGDRFAVTFPDAPMPFELEVVEASSDSIEWYVAENPPWWKGTTIGFGLAQNEAGMTSLLFTHRGFDAEDPIIPMITPAWVRFLDNLVAVAESGVADAAVKN